MTATPLDPDNPPAWADEGVHLSGYDPSWPDRAAELDGRPWRRFFAKVSQDDRHRLAHLHLMSAGAARWDQQLMFRDALRASPVLRDEYVLSCLSI